MRQAALPLGQNLLQGFIGYNNLGFGVKVFSDAANLKFVRFRLFNNTRIAMELPKKLYGRWERQGLHDSTLVGWAGIHFGLRLAHSHKWTVSGVTFENFKDCGWLGSTRACSTAVVNYILPCRQKRSGGYSTRFARTTWLNAPMRTGWKWVHQHLLQDLDGTFAGTSGPAAVVPANSLLLNQRAFPSCRLDLRYGIPREPSCGSRYTRGIVCEGLEFRRFTMGIEKAPGEPWMTFRGLPIIISQGMLHGDRPFGRFVSAQDDDWMINKWRVAGTNTMLEMDLTLATTSPQPLVRHAVGDRPQWRSLDVVRLSERFFVLSRECTAFSSCGSLNATLNVKETRLMFSDGTEWLRCEKDTMRQFCVGYFRYSAGQDGVAALSLYPGNKEMTSEYAKDVQLYQRKALHPYYDYHVYAILPIDVERKPAISARGPGSSIRILLPPPPSPLFLCWQQLAHSKGI